MHNKKILYIFTDCKEGGKNSSGIYSNEKDDENRYSSFLDFRQVKNDAFMKAFQEDDGSYSVRKFGGYMSLIILAYLIISYTIANDFKEVPTAYLVSIDTIVVFYFFKKAIGDVKIGSKSSTTDAPGNNEK